MIALQHVASVLPSLVRLLDSPCITRRSVATESVLIQRHHPNLGQPMTTCFHNPVPRESYSTLVQIELVVSTDFTTVDKQDPIVDKRLKLTNKDDPAQYIDLVMTNSSYAYIYDQGNLTSPGAGTSQYWTRNFQV